MLGFHFSKTPAKTTKNLCYFSTLTNWSAGPSGGGGGAPKASPPPPYVLRTHACTQQRVPKLLITQSRATPRESPGLPMEGDLAFPILCRSWTQW